MRCQYTRQELESITQETAIYIEGAGIDRKSTRLNSSH